MMTDDVSLLVIILCICYTSVSGIYVLHDNADYSRIPSSSTKIGVIDVLDEIQIDFDIIIHSFSSPSQHSSIIHFGNNADEKYPSIYINDDSQSLIIEYTSVSDNAQSWQHAITTNTIYHVQITATQTNIVLTIDNNIVYNGPVTSHSILFDRDIYISNPWNNPCDCTIKGLTVTTDNSNVPFNYLCDYANRFTVISGDWTHDTSTCYLTQNDYSLDKASIWMGDADTNTLLWTDYSIEMEFVITYDGASPGAYPDAMITLRQSQYLDEYGIYLEAMNSNPLGMLLFNSGSTTLFKEPVSISPVLNTMYKLRVDVTGDTFEIYVNDNLEYTQIDSTHLTGSIGLRTFRCIVEFRSLYITFPNDGKLYTMNPSTSPTNIPSNYPTITTKIPSISPTRIPSNIPTKTTKMPSISPTRLPSIPPSETPSLFPTKTPTSSPTNIPSISPTRLPSNAPTEIPSRFPSKFPSSSPTQMPSQTPTMGIFICICLCMIIQIYIYKRADTNNTTNCLGC